MLRQDKTRHKRKIKGDVKQEEKIKLKWNNVSSSFFHEFPLEKKNILRNWQRTEKIYRSTGACTNNSHVAQNILYRDDGRHR